MPLTRPGEGEKATQRANVSKCPYLFIDFRSEAR
jgi:hypothetical protein